MATMPQPIRLAFSPEQLDAIDRMLDVAVRKLGLSIVLEVAELVTSIRCQRESAEGCCTLTPAHVSTVVRCADAACRAGGLGMAETAVGLLGALRECQAAAEEHARVDELERLRAELDEPEAAPESAAVTRVELLGSEGEG